MSGERKSKITIVWWALGIALLIFYLREPKHTSHQRVGQHDLVIISTPLFGGTTHSTFQGADDHYSLYTLERRGLKVRLENEVLTVNGKRYVIPRKNDSIRIEDDRIEINGQWAKPEDG